MTFKFAILTTLLAAATLAVLEVESRAVPVQAASRDKRAAYRLGMYPERTMMFTGFYRPTRHSEKDQVGGVYAQGGSVSGGTYFGKQPHYLKDDGPEPAEESEIASANAEASPAAQEYDGKDEQLGQEHGSAEQRPQDNPDNGAESPIYQNSSKPEKPSQNQPSKSKKAKHLPVPAEDESDEYDGDEDDEPLSPFRPGKPGKGKPNKQYPSFNNYFPMVFSFPRAIAGRRGSSSNGSIDSIPGMIAAIANSYSTGKGGVASSVATAYGGSTTKKQRRPSYSQVH